VSYQIIKETKQLPSWDEAMPHPFYLTDFASDGMQNCRAKHY